MKENKYDLLWSSQMRSRYKSPKTHSLVHQLKCCRLCRLIIVIFGEALTMSKAPTSVKIFPSSSEGTHFDNRDFSGVDTVALEEN